MTTAKFCTKKTSLSILVKGDEHVDWMGLQARAEYTPCSKEPNHADWGDCMWKNYIKMHEREGGLRWRAVG